MQAPASARSSKNASDNPVAAMIREVVRPRRSTDILASKVERVALSFEHSSKVGRSEGAGGSDLYLAGAPGRIRTCGLGIRSPPLYPD